MNDKYDLIDKERLETYLEKIEMNNRCILCGKEALKVVGDCAFQISAAAIGTNIANIEKSMPLIAVVCTNCGNTLFINALSQDLLKPPYVKREEAAKDGEE